MREQDKHFGWIFFVVKYVELFTPQMSKLVSKTSLYQNDL